MKRIRSVMAVFLSVSVVMNPSTGAWEVGILRAAKRASSNNDPSSDPGDMSRENTPPTISKIVNRIIGKNTSATATFLVNDAETPQEVLTVSATSDNLNLIPNQNLALEGTGGERVLTATPSLDTEGSATITVTVSDAGGRKNSTTFSLTAQSSLPYAPGEILVVYRKSRFPSAAPPSSTSPGGSSKAALSPRETLHPLSSRPLLANRTTNRGAELSRQNLKKAPGVLSSRVPPGGEALAAKSLDILQRTFVLTFDPHQDVQNLQEILLRDPNVELAQKNPIYSIQRNLDPFLVQGDLWGIKKVQAEGAWEKSTKGEGIVVAVIDTGVDMVHPDLAENIFTNINEIPENGLDDDANGFVDDIHGWNFVSIGNDPTDDNNHGTHVSGTIAAVGENGIGVIGVAFKSKIMPIKIFPRNGIGSRGAVESIVYATDMGADVINTSWGSRTTCDESNVLFHALNYAYGRGVTVVSAAMNENEDVANFSPVGCPNVIAVSATDSSDGKASFSNWGSRIDVAAPGVGIYSSIISGHQYGLMSGTSMAAPHVSGLAALILAQFPTYTNNQVRQLIRSSADDIGARGIDPYFGFGRINAARALGAPSPVPDSQAPSSPLDLRWESILSNRMSLTWSPSTDNGEMAGYLLDLSTSSEFTSFVKEYQSRDVGNMTSFTLNNLQPTTTYYVRLQAKDNWGNLSNYSVPLSGTTQALDTQAPLRPKMTNSSCLRTYCSVNWGETYDNVGVVGYYLDVSTNPEFSPASFVVGYEKKNMGKSTSDFISPLLPSTHYYARVRAQDEAGNLSLNSETKTLVTSDLPDTEAPSAPMIRIFSANSSTTARLIWEEAKDNAKTTGYLLDISTDIEFSTFVEIHHNEDLGNRLETTVSGLKPGTTYYARLRAYDAAANVSNVSYTYETKTWETNASHMVVLSKPTRAKIFYSFNGGSWTDSGQWTNASFKGWPVGSYQVKLVRSGYADFFSEKKNLIPNGALTFDAEMVPIGTLEVSSMPPGAKIFYSYNGGEWTDSGFQSNHVFSDFRAGEYRVKLVEDGYREYQTESKSMGPGATIWFNVDRIPPAIPEELILDVLSTTELQLHWLSSVDNVGVTRYLLDLSENEDFSSFVDGYQSRDIGIVPSYTVKGLFPGTIYYIRLRAGDAEGNISNFSGVMSGATDVLDILPPSTPNGIQASSDFPTRFTLSWLESTDNKKVAGYKVDLSRDSEFKSYVEGYQNKDVGNVTRFEGSGLSPSTPYFARVRAYDLTGNISIDSEIVHLRTVDDSQAPTPPTIVDLEAITPTKLRIYWSRASDDVAVIGYKLDLSLDPAFSSFVEGFNAHLLSGSSPSELAGLTPSARYYARLRSFDAAGNESTNSNVFMANTPPADTLAPTKPLNLSARAFKYDSVIVNWEPSEDNVGVTGYLLDLSLNESFSTFVEGYENRLVSSGNVSFKMTGLQPMTTYFTRVRARDEAGNISVDSDVLSVKTARDESPPTAPGVPRVTKVSETRLDLAWDSATDNVNVTAYLVDISTDAWSSFLPGYKSRDVGTVRSISVSGLNPVFTYYIRLRARDQAGNTSADSLSVSVQLDPIVPSIPGALRVTPVSSTHLNLTWAASTDNVGVAGYVLDLSTDSFSTFVEGYQNRNVGNVTSRAVPDLLPSTRYYARLRAVDAAGNMSEHSDAAVGSTLPVPDWVLPSIPAHPQMSVVSPTKLNLTWDPSTDNVGVTGYLLDVSTKADFSSSVGVHHNLEVGNVAHFEIVGLNANTRYFARLKAHDAAGNTSDFSASVWGETPPDVESPTPPTETRLEVVSDSALTLTWTASTDNGGVTDYLVDLSTDPGFSSFVEGNQDRNVGDVTSVLLSTLNSSTTYFARVRARDAVGNVSLPSGTAIGKTLPETKPPSAPSNPQLTTVSSMQLNLTWTASIDNVGVTGYSIDLSNRLDFSTFVPGFENKEVGNVTNFRIQGLIPSRRYYARIRARDAVGNISSFSPSSQAMTMDVDGTEPTVPRQIKLIPISSSQLTLSWDPSSDNVGVTGYIVDVSTNPMFGIRIPEYENRDVGNVNRVDITGLQPSTVYYAWVRAYDEAGNTSHVYERAVARTQVLDPSDIIAPVPPSNPTLKAVSLSALSLEWEASDDVDVLGYSVDVSLTPSFSTFLEGYRDRKLLNVTRLEMFGLAPATNYCVRLRSYDGGGNISENGSAVCASTLPDTLPPLAPKLLETSNATSAGFKIHWMPSSDNIEVTRYWMDVSMESEFGTFVDGYKNLDVGNVTTGVVSGLRPGKIFFVRVRAKDAAGNLSDYSSVLSATTLEASDNQPPSVPGNPALLLGSSTQLNLVWDVSSDNVAVTAYLLDLSTDPSFSSYVPGQHDKAARGTRAWTFYGLEPHTTYYARLRAQDGEGNVSGYSAVVSLSTSLPSSGNPI